MFDEVIDNISLNTFKNLGSAYSFKDKDNVTLFFSVKGNEVLSVVDNLGKYFFVVKSNAEITADKQKSCASWSLRQDYTFNVIAECPMSLWLVSHFNNMALTDTDNIDTVRLTVNNITEVRKKEKLILHEISVTFDGHMNKCDVVMPCCC
jgi:hypothetical protein